MKGIVLIVKYLSNFSFQFFVGRLSDAFKLVLYKLGNYLPIRGVASVAAGNKSVDENNNKQKF